MRLTRAGRERMDFERFSPNAPVEGSLVVVSDRWMRRPRSERARSMHLFAVYCAPCCAAHAPTIERSGAQAGSTHDGGRNTGVAGRMQAVVSTLEIRLLRLVGGQE